jgi:hypothetical protein
VTGKAILLSPLGFAGLGLFVYADANDVEDYVPGNKVTASMGGIGSLPYSSQIYVQYSELHCKHNQYIYPLSREPSLSASLWT